MKRNEMDSWKCNTVQFEKYEIKFSYRKVEQTFIFCFVFFDDSTTSLAQRLGEPCAMGTRVPGSVERFSAELRNFRKQKKTAYKPKQTNENQVKSQPTKPTKTKKC